MTTLTVATNVGDNPPEENAIESGPTVTLNRLTYVGHATVEIELDGARLITDPVLRNRVVHLKRQVPLPESPHARKPDAILLSHAHFDHLDLPSLRGFGSEVRIICGPGAGEFLSRKGFKRVEEVAVASSTSVGPVTVTAVPAMHDGRRRPGAAASEAVGFLITGTQQVYFAGDTDLYREMAAISDRVDLALIPVWGWGHTLGEGHMDPERAAHAVGLIKPRMVVPIHWGTLFPMISGRFGRHHLSRPPRHFADQVAADSPEVDVVLLEPGEATELD